MNEHDTNQCDWGLQVQAYHDQQLPAHQRAAVEQHLANCGPCSVLLQRLTTLSTAFAQFTGQGPRLSQIGLHRLHRRVAEEMDRGVVRLAGATSGIAAAVMLIGSLWLVRAQQAPAPAAAPPWVGVSASFDTQTLAQQDNTPTAQWYLADATRTNEP